MEILKITGKLKEKKKSMKNTPSLEPVLGKATIDIMEKVDLLDKGKFDEWIKDIKEAVSVIHKIDKSDDDILDASTKLESILTSEQSLTFLRMLDSGLFNAVAEKIKNAKEGKFDEVIEKAEKVAEPKPDNVEKSYPVQLADIQEPVNFMQLSAAREFVHADALLCKEA